MRVQRVPRGASLSDHSEGDAFVTYTIDEARTDTDLRWAGRLIARTVSDVPPQGALGTLDQRAQSMFGPDPLLLIAREGRTIIGALNSHAPIMLAEAARQMFGPEGARLLVEETRLLEHLGVDAGHRRKGIAHDLVARAAKRHADGGVHLWFGFLDHRDDRPGVREFYNATGFQFARSLGDLPEPLGSVSRGTKTARKGDWFWRDLRRRPLEVSQ